MVSNTGEATSYGNSHGKESAAPTQGSKFHALSEAKGPSESEPVGTGTIAPEEVHKHITGTKGEAEKLDPGFRIHDSSQFQPGEVFKVLWSEPRSSTSSDQTEITAGSSKYGEESFMKIRRFVIVAADKTWCQCVPILTYLGQGLGKNGVKPDEHAIIYTSKDPPPLMEGEGAISKGSIQVIPRTPRDKLDPSSRVNYAKVYTVEHNVKVLFIGRIAKGDRVQFNRDFDATWASKRAMNFNYQGDEAIEDSKPEDVTTSISLSKTSSKSHSEHQNPSDKFPHSEASELNYSVQDEAPKTALISTEAPELQPTIFVQHQKLVASSRKPTFTDSGFCSSNERDVIPESKNLYDGKDSAVDLSGSKSNRVGDSSKISSNSLPESDIVSIVSNGDDVQSQIPSNPRYEERNAESVLGLLLAQSPELKRLFEEALERIGRARFADNFRRLLKQFFIDTSSFAETKLEKATVNLFRSRYSRTRISQQICDIINPEDDEFGEQLMKEISDKRQWLENWLAQNPDFYPPELDPRQEDSQGKEIISDQRIPLAGELASIDDSDFEDEDEPVAIEAPFRVPNINEMEHFLLNCGDGNPFKKLLGGMGTFLLPASLIPLLRTISSIPLDRIWLESNNGKSLPNRAKLFIENATEDNWNWWPLTQPIRVLERDEIRLNWTCHCGSQLWVEIPRVHGENLKMLARLNALEISENTLCSRIKRRHSSWSISSLFGTITALSHFPQVKQSTSPNQVPLLGPEPGPKPGPRSSANADHAAPASTTPQSNIAQLTAPETNNSVAGMPTACHQDTSVDVLAGINSELFVILGVDGKRRTLDICHLDISKHKDDGDFFKGLLREYRKFRGFLRYWFSVWQLRHCDFVKFEKIMKNRVIIAAKDDLPEDMTYEYTPRPPNAQIPPIGPHEFELALASCGSPCFLSFFHDCLEPPDGTIAIEKIPKRKGVFEIKVGNREYAWGLSPHYSISFVLILWYHVLMLAGPFTFCTTWKAYHPDDVQNISVPVATFAMALISMFWSASGVLKGSK